MSQDGDDWEAAVRNLADRAAISDILGRFVRGSDRYDRALVASCYWPGAVDNHGGFNGPADQYVEWAEQKTDAFLRMTHILGHSNFDFAADIAVVETSFLFFATHPDGPSGFADVLMVGRYIDRFEKKDGAWRIARRQVVIDWNRSLPDSPGWNDFSAGTTYRLGARGAEDPLHSILVEAGFAPMMGARA